MLINSIILVAQEEKEVPVENVKADIKLYKKYTVEKDSIVIDTSLTIQDEYNYNYLRKDNFGLQQVANEGYIYQFLDFNKKFDASQVYDIMGFNGKSPNYLQVNDIYYYSVPTPITDLYFKTTFRQGQSIDGLVTTNVSKRFNFSLAYKSMSSVGDYFNNAAKDGHFRFTSSYNSKNKKYFFNLHYVDQDIFNQENGGILELAQLSGSNPTFDNRERVQVLFDDGFSRLEGKRFFLDHYYKANSNNGLVFKHTALYEYKFYEFNQAKNEEVFGKTLNESDLSNFSISRNEVVYNKLGVSFVSKWIGEINFFIDNLNNNYFYPFANTTNLNYYLQNRINTIGGEYNFNYKKWFLNVKAQNSIGEIPTLLYQASGKYSFSDKELVKISILKNSKLPQNNARLLLNDYINYNWNNSFNNTKETALNFDFISRFFNLTFDYKLLEDYVYFKNLSEGFNQISVKPFQENRIINYLSAEIQKEVRVGKFAWDNRVKYQSVIQEEKIINVPQFFGRSTIYFIGKIFKKKMLINTGFNLNLFTKYFADNYDPVVGEFYTQTISKVGGFPLVDFFINARVRQTRIYLKAEHLNQLFTDNTNFLVTPNQPYRDFKVRFGVEWNFFR